MKRPLHVLLLSVLPMAVTAQDTAAVVRSGRNINLDINLTGGWYKQNPSVDDVSGRQHVYIPPGLPRRAHDLATRSAWNLDNDYMTDNPLRHGCVYLDIGLRARIGKDLILYGDLIGEHRGFSGGLYNTANLILYPKMRAVCNRGFSLFGQPLTAGFSGGFRDSLRQLEGLTVYNMDVDNATLFLRWKHLRYTLSDIGDLMYTGLNIDDQASTTVALEAVPLRRKWKMDIRAAATVNTGYTARLHADVSAGFYLPGRMRLYAQLSRRLTEVTGSRNAALAGANFTVHAGRFSLKSFLEARYYGAGYNHGYIFEDVYFRPKRGLTNATDFVGPYLYPLMLFERPYSKWAVYTEYQNRNVTALNAWADISCHLFDHFFANAQLDFNLIKPSDLDWVWLPFYRAGLGYEVLKDNMFLVSLTNKAMNLDKHYPDFYLLSEYSLQLQFTRTFSWE